LDEYCLLPVTSAIYPIDRRDRNVWALRNRAPLIHDPAQLDEAIERGGAWLVVRGPHVQANVALGNFIHAFRERRVTIEEEHRQGYPGLELIHVEIFE
jgi:hypothetical protein